MAKNKKMSKDLTTIEMLENTALSFHENIHLDDELLAKARLHFTEEEVSCIHRAFLYANDLHRGQLRASGEPYIIHPVAVAYILLVESHLYDVNSICAALLHDTIEDTGITEEELAQIFNPDIAYLVASVSKIKDLNFTSQTEEEQYNTYLLIRGLMQDYRVISIKLADRIHNMRTLMYKGDKREINKYKHATSMDELKIKVNAKQKEKSSETLSLFVPIADRIGAYAARVELENIAFFYLNNHKYREINGNINNYLEAHQPEIEQAMDTISKVLSQHGIKHYIKAQEKKPFEVFCLLKPKQKLSSIPDLVSYEIVVPDKKDCYLAACYLEEAIHPIEAGIKNYIAVPKSNGYRAYHTIVVQNDFPIELKICSQKMSLINNYGFAALKEVYPEKTIAEIRDELNQMNQFQKDIQSIDSLCTNYKDFTKQFSDEILATQIEVYSKDGECYSLPKGATVLDFAFKIHSEIGNQAIGAVINGKEVPISQTLKNGDSVQVILDVNQSYQNENTLEFVTTALAKKKIHEGINRGMTLKLKK